MPQILSLKALFSVAFHDTALPACCSSSHRALTLCPLKVILTVEVIRVGCFTSPGGLGGRGWLSIIPEDTSLEDRNLRRITNLLVAVSDLSGEETSSGS